MGNRGINQDKQSGVLSKSALQVEDGVPFAVRMTEDGSGEKYKKCHGK